MKHLRYILVFASVSVLACPSIGQTSIDRVTFKFREHSGLLKPHYRGVTIVIDGGGLHASVKVQVEKSSTEDHMTIRKRLDELLVNAKSLDDTMKVLNDPSFSNTKDTTFFVPIAEFDVIESLLLAVNSQDVSKSLGMQGHDGNTSEVEFGNVDNTIKYKVWSVTYGTKKRGLETLLKSMNQILLTAHIKPKDIWRQ